MSLMIIIINPITPRINVQNASANIKQTYVTIGILSPSFGYYG